MVFFRQALYAAATAATLVNAATYADVYNGMQSIHSTMQNLQNLCSNWNGQCQTFFPQNNGYYQLTALLVQEKADTSSSPSFTSAQAGTLSNFCASTLYMDFKLYQACIVNKANAFISIGAKYTECQQLQAIQNAVDTWLPILLTKMVTSTQQNDINYCKQGIDTSIGYAKSGLGLPCP